MKPEVERTLWLDDSNRQIVRGTECGVEANGLLACPVGAPRIFFARALVGAEVELSIAPNPGQV